MHLHTCASCTLATYGFSNRMLIAVECFGDGVWQLSKDDSARKPRECASRSPTKAEGSCLVARLGQRSTPRR